MRPIVLLAFLAALGAGLSSCKKDDRPRSASWSDPVGDVQEFPGEPSWVQPDIVKAEARCEDEHIVLSAEMPFSIEDYYGQLSEEGLRRGQLLAVFYLDADDDPATGRHPLMLPERGGYEFSIPLSLGFWAKSKETGLIRAGRVTFDPRTFVYKRVPAYEAFRLHADYQEPLSPGIHAGVKSYDELTTTRENRMEVRVPYKLLGVKSGDAVRLSYHEASAGLHPEAYGEDKTFVLE